MFINAGWTVLLIWKWIKRQLGVDQIFFFFFPQCQGTYIIEITEPVRSVVSRDMGPNFLYGIFNTFKKELANVFSPPNFLAAWS